MTAQRDLGQISGLEDEWVIEWPGGHAVARGVTAFAAHSTVAGAPSYGSCHCWRWDGPATAETDNNGDSAETTKEARTCQKD